MSRQNELTMRAGNTHELSEHTTSRRHVIAAGAGMSSRAIIRYHIGWEVVQSVGFEPDGKRGG
mgnify:FL=1|jgi:hypothetical protein